MDICLALTTKQSVNQSDAECIHVIFTLATRGVFHRPVVQFSSSTIPIPGVKYTVLISENQLNIEAQHPFRYYLTFLHMSTQRMILTPELDGSRVGNIIGKTTRMTTGVRWRMFPRVWQYSGLFRSHVDRQTTSH